jgi:hypothetical protein
LIEKTLWVCEPEGGKTASIQRLLENLLAGMNIYFMESERRRQAGGRCGEIRFESAVVRICI